MMVSVKKYRTGKIQIQKLRKRVYLGKSSERLDLWGIVEFEIQDTEVNGQC